MAKELLWAKLHDDLHERIMKGEKKPSAKVFKLLYQASRDGCSVEDFQQKCQEKSPTLTVLYGSTGTIFGGYTSKPWTSKGKAVIRDPSAFLFYCHQNNQMETLEMSPTNYGWAITCNGDTGPSFGGGKLRAFDLQVFKKLGEAKKFECEDGYFRRNGNLNLNCTYVSKDKSFRRESINAGELYVKNVEVYEVCEATMGIDTETQRRLKGETTSRDDRKGVMLDNVKKHIQSNVVKKEVSFRLLFQAKNDGCTAESFHKKCDAVGRTLTVMYGRKYFYGGFTAVNWQSGHQVRKQDENAFLFCQNVAKNDKLLTLPHFNGNDAITCDSTYGPTFGCSGWFKTHDFQAFRGNAPTEQYEYGYFDTNGCVNINNTYKNSQVRSEYDFHDGDKYVYDIEVYAVEVKHRTEYVHTLLKSMERKGVNLNVLCVGKAKTGKSFYIDSVMSTMRGRLTHNASGGLLRKTDDSSRGTQKFLWHTLRITDPQKCAHRTNVKFLDMPGFDNDNAVDIEQIRNVIEGHCPEDYALLNRIDNNTAEYIHNPKWHNKAHVVCFVVDDISLTTPQKENEMLQSIISDILVPNEIPYVVVLTKTDKIDDTARNAISKVSNLFGVKVGRVHTVQNYVNEETVVEAIDIPVLKVLQAIMEEGIAYYQTHTEKSEEYRKDSNDE